MSCENFWAYESKMKSSFERIEWTSSTEKRVISTENGKVTEIILSQDQSYILSEKECKQVVALYHDTSRASANNLEAAKYIILVTVYGQTYKHQHHDIHVNTSTVLNTIATYLTVECEKEIRISNYSSLDKKF